MSQELDSAILQGLGILFGVGIPVVAIMLVREWLSNMVAGIQIKMNSNYQYVNCFEFEGRKKCRIINIHITSVEIQDMESNQSIVMFNREFIKAKVWRNIERARRERTSNSEIKGNKE